MISYYITSRHQLTSKQDGYDSSKALSLLESKVINAYKAGIEYIQLREKDLSGLQLANVVERLSQSPNKGSSKLIVNGRLDVAAVCGADGVHFPADGIPISAARNLLHRSGLIVGASCHNESEARRAEEDGANYVLLAPIFETPSKPGKEPLGLKVLETVSRRLRIPVIALGGIDVGNAERCISAGAAGIAGIRLYQQAEDLAGLCRRLRALKN